LTWTLVPPPGPLVVVPAAKLDLSSAALVN
jgi:hypothetical protein